MSPLSALGLVAGHGVGKLDLQSGEVRVLAHGCHAVGLAGQVGIVVEHALIELVALLTGERRRIGREAVEDYGRLVLIVVVVGELEPHVGEVEPVHLALTAHLDHATAVAIGNEGKWRTVIALDRGRREIMVLDDHEPVARGEQVVATVEDGGTYAEIVDTRRLVGAGHDDGVVDAHVVVALAERLDEFVAGHHADIGKTLQTYARQLGHGVVGNHGAYQGGVVEYSALSSLSYHLVEVGLEDRESIALEHLGSERRRLFLAHRRELGGVADEHKPAVAPAIDIGDKVVEQTARAKDALTQSLVGYHRSLVDHEEGIGMEIVVEIEDAATRCHGALAVYLAVDGEGSHATVVRQHLGGSPGGCQEHHLLPEAGERAHQGSGEGGLARTRRTAHHHHGMVVTESEKAGYLCDSPMLVGGGAEAHLLLHA